MICFLIDLGLNALLIPRFGMMGAAMSTALTLTGLFGVGLVALRRRLGLTPFGWESTHLLLAALVAFAGAQLSMMMPLETWWLRGGLSFAVATILFAAIIALFGITEGDREFARSVILNIQERSEDTQSRSS